MTAIHRLLIANRGEIACRVIRTAANMGIETVAVYSDADRHSPHVKAADQAVRIGPAPASESYLNAAAIIDVAKAVGANAIHPGYGFLSENADFAAAVEEAEIIFVGPSVNAIRAMGSKVKAKQLMKKAGVPLVPGYVGHKQNIDTLGRAAEDIGYPLLVKASAGGGGKGMRVVSTASELSGAIATAKREAKSAFGDDRVMLEKYLPRARHIEVQVFGDHHGNVIYLYERDCSAQRRHQKVIEEAPAPRLSAAMRTSLGQAAVAVAKCIDYVGAGTVEFLVARDSFYFIEMNTRLQVEHPVTETVTGIDLVAWQLRIAAGEPLPLAQDDIAINGHAFEARVYAEDPDNGFLPQAGRLSRVSFPSFPGVRIEIGVSDGDEVSVHYDPMLAKIIASGESREHALQKLRSALQQTEIVGVKTNIDFLIELTGSKTVRDARVDTAWLDRRRKPKGGWSRLCAASAQVLITCAMAALTQARRQSIADAGRTHDPYSPWFLGDGWRLNKQSTHTVTLVDRGAQNACRDIVLIASADGSYTCDLDGGRHHVAMSEDAVEIDGQRFVMPYFLEDVVSIFTADGRYELALPLPAQMGDSDDEHAVDGWLTAPMPGKVTSIHITKGDSVRKGQSLIVIEAMKMEHTMASSTSGIVKDVRCVLSEQVEEGAPLAMIEAET